MQPGGTKGPPLDDVGAALTPAELCLSVVNFSRITRNPDAEPSQVGRIGRAGGEANDRRGRGHRRAPC